MPPTFFVTNGRAGIVTSTSIGAHAPSEITERSQFISGKSMKGCGPFAGIDPSIRVAPPPQTSLAGLMPQRFIGA
jgi:hypothetical protein